ILQSTPTSEAVLRMLANAVAVVPTSTDRLLGRTAAASGPARLVGVLRTWPRLTVGSTALRNGRATRGVSPPGLMCTAPLTPDWQFRLQALPVGAGRRFTEARWPERWRPERAASRRRPRFAQIEPPPRANNDESTTAAAGPQAKDVRRLRE